MLEGFGSSVCYLREREAAAEFKACPKAYTAAKGILLTAGNLLLKELDEADVGLRQGVIGAPIAMTPSL